MTHVREEFALCLVGDFRALLCAHELRCPRNHFSLELLAVPQQAALVALHLRNHVVEILDERPYLVAALRIGRPQRVVLGRGDLVGSVGQCQDRRRYDPLQCQ